MKLSRIASLLAGAGILACAQVALASGGTITFEGEVTAVTCTINGGGTANDFTVTLSPTQTSALTAAGMNTGWKPFTIALTDCDPDTGSVAALFLPGTGVNNVTGNLINLLPSGNGVATNVEIGLREADNSAIHIGTATQQGTPLTAGAATLTYQAGYVATGAATAGLVKAEVTYFIDYP